MAEPTKDDAHLVIELAQLGSQMVHPKARGWIWSDELVSDGDEFFEKPRSQEVAYSASAERADATLLMAKAYLALGGKENSEQAEIWLLKVAALYKKFAEPYNAACDLLVDTYEKLGNKARSGEWRSRKVTAAVANGGGAETGSK